MILLRPDLMRHRHFAPSKTYLLSCFLLAAPSRAAASGADPSHHLNPGAKALHEWQMRRMLQLKEEEQECGLLSGVCDEFHSLVDRNFCSPRTVSVRSLAGRYSSAWNVETWHDSHSMGVDLVVEVPAMRWPVDKHYDEAPDAWSRGKSFLRHGSFTEGIELFDATFFGFSTHEAASTDPMQRMTLEVSYEALHRGGYSKSKLRHNPGSVYVGGKAGSCISRLPDPGAQRGCALGVNANRVSFSLGLTGLAMTCDMDGASSLGSVHLGAEAVLRSREGQPGDCDAFSLAGGAHLMLSQAEWPLLQRAGLLSARGRCLTWDGSADGFCMGDGCGFCLLTQMLGPVEGEEHEEAPPEPREGLIVSSVINHNGHSTCLHAPSSAAEQELISRAVDVAGICAANVDAVECNGQAGQLHDAVEVSALGRVLRGSRGECQQALCLTAVKSQTGHTMECAGIASLSRAILASSRGAMAPSAHLRRLNGTMSSSLAKAPLGLLTDCLDFSSGSSFTGVSARGAGGTNAHAIAFGQSARHAWRQTEDAMPQLTFWPAGGGQLEQSMIPTKGYFIAGTWSRWEPEPMEDEGGGSHGYTMTLGENRWEEFQLTLDGDSSRSLHPEQPRGGFGARVFGPDPDAAGLHWRIGGVRPCGALALEASAAADSVIAEGPAAATAPVLEGRAGQSVASIPTAVEQGRIGDKYRIHLRVAGKYRSVIWERLVDQAVDPQSVPAGQYYVVSDLNGWTFQPMQQRDGCWYLDVQIPRARAEFLVARNEDWSQIIYPARHMADASESVHGPGHSNEVGNSSWLIQGKAGDKMRITFERRVASEPAQHHRGSEFSVSWEALSEEQKAAIEEAPGGVVRGGADPHYLD